MEGEKMADVICIGASVVDIPLRPVSKNIFDIESYPVDRIAMTIGGDAINEATIISRLGYKTALMSRIGADAPGKFILDFCRKEGINIESLRIDPKVDTSINVGLVTEDGERTFVTNRNGSLWKTDITDVDFTKFKGARLLTLASIFNCPLLDNKSLVQIFKKAKEEGMIICADMIKPRFSEKLEDIGEALGYIDYFFPNYDEASLLSGEKDLEAIADSFLKYGVKNVIIKTGKKGCFIKTEEKSMQVPAVSGIRATDTIGAGDNFAAGFITALLDGKNLLNCAQFANATASIAVQSAGATTGVTDKKQVEKVFEYYG
jgi:sugar/nucleoside kinase (ribokinase family)